MYDFLYARIYGGEATNFSLFDDAVNAAPDIGGLISLTIEIFFFRGVRSTSGLSLLRHLSLETAVVL